MEETTGLKTKEASGGCLTWPSELSILEQTFVREFITKDYDTLTSNRNLSAEQHEKCTDKQFNTPLDLNQVLEERDGLRKMNIALKIVITMFTKYLTNCEEEQNYTLIKTLLDAEKLKNDEIISIFKNNSQNLDSTFESSKMKTLLFSSNQSDLVNLFENNEHTNSEYDPSFSVNESEFKSWLHLLKTEASTILKLISNQKCETNSDTTSNRDEVIQPTPRESGLTRDYVEKDVQTVITGEQFENDQEKIKILRDCVENCEVNWSSLNGELEYLGQLFRADELIEGYGEATNSVPYMDRISGVPAPQKVKILESEPASESDAIYESEEYCAKCDKIRREAKKDVEELEAEVEHLKHKLNQNQKNLKSLTLERDAEREEFDRELKTMKEKFEDKEQEIHINTRGKFKSEIQQLEQQVKELNIALEECTVSKKSLETKVISQDKKLKSLRDDNGELEKKLLEKSESVGQLELKLKNKETELKNHQEEYRNIIQQLEKWTEFTAEPLEEINSTHVSSSNVIDKMKNELTEIEKVVNGRTRMLECTYLPIIASNVSSPSSEVISVSDLTYEGKLFSISESDLSSSSSCAPVSFDQFACLYEKLKKLFRAEDATFKKIRDQEMHIARINEAMKKLEVEKETLSESLYASSTKLSETKIELENWQRGYNSDVQLELTEKIRKLESHIELYKKYLSQKDEHDSKLVRTIMDLQLFIESSDHEDIFNKLKQESELCRQEKLLLQKLLDGLDDDSEDYSTRKSLISHESEDLSEIDEKHNSKKNRVSFAEDLESFIDSDVSRRAEIIDMSSVIKFAHVVKSSGEHLNNSKENMSVLDNKQKFDVEQPTIAQIKNLENDSIDIDSNVMSSTKYNSEKRESSSALGEVSDSQSEEQDVKAEMRILREKLKRERQTKQTKSWRKREAELISQIDTLENDLRNLQGELNLSEKTSMEYKERVAALSKELEDSKKIAKNLETKLGKVEVELNGRKEQKLNSKHEEYSVQITQLTDELKAERTKSALLNQELEKAITDGVALQELTNNLQNTVERINEALENEKKRVKISMKLNDDLKDELENMKTKSKDGISSSNSASLEGCRTDSLINLAEKVQKEVQSTIELDEHMYKENFSLLEDLLKMFSTFSPAVMRILFKGFREGNESLTVEDREILTEYFDLLDTKSIAQLEEIEILNKKLLSELEKEKRVVEDYVKKEKNLRSENKRLETVLNYFEEKISSLVTKLDEYRSRYVTNEIELSSERCTRNRLEVQISNLKKESIELKNQFDKQKENYINKNSALIKENLDLKQEIDLLRNQSEVLTAEMNSVKVLTQYHSDSDTELSRSLNPLKLRLDEVQEKYSRLKQEYEKKKTDFQSLKVNLTMEKHNNQKLENMFKESLNDKRELEKEFIDLKMKYNDLDCQKQKIDAKLKAAELVEMKRRKLRADKDGLARKEAEFQHQLEEEYGKLKENVFKIKEEFQCLHHSWKGICEEIPRLFFRMLVAEKNQRALVYQKNYLMCTNNKMDTVIRNWSNSDEIYFNRTTDMVITAKQKFKSVALVVVWLRRMKFLVALRPEHSRQMMIQYFTNKLPDVKLYPWFDFLVDFVPGNNLAALGDTNEHSNQDVEFPLIDDSLKTLYRKFKDLQNTYK